MWILSNVQDTTEALNWRIPPRRATAWDNPPPALFLSPVIPSLGALVGRSGSFCNLHRKRGPDPHFAAFAKLRVCTPFALAKLPALLPFSQKGVSPIPSRFPHIALRPAPWVRFVDYTAVGNREYFDKGGEGIPFEQVVADLGFTMEQIRGAKKEQ